MSVCASDSRLRPERCLAGLLDLRLRHHESRSPELRDGVAAAAVPDHPAQHLDKTVGIRRTAVVDGERRLVDGELRDRKPCSHRIQRERAAGRVAVHECRPAERIDDRPQVVELACRRIWLRVAAVAASATVVVDDGEPPGKCPGEFSGIRPGAERTADDHDGRPVADRLVRDPRAVGRRRVRRRAILHWGSPINPTTALAITTKSLGPVGNGCILLCSESLPMPPIYPSRPIILRNAGRCGARLGVRARASPAPTRRSARGSPAPGGRRPTAAGRPRSPRQPAPPSPAGRWRTPPA